MFDEWPEQDRDEAMALVYVDSLKCPCGCGNYVDESMSRDWDWDVRSTKCYAGAAIDQIKRDFAKRNKGVEGVDDGLLWSATPVPPVKPRT